MSSKIDELQKRAKDAQESGDIASLYVLESQIHEVFNEEQIQDFYATILDLALEKLTDTLESHKKFDLSEVQDFATVRALYEYAMEHYGSEAIQDAAALFEVLSGMTNDDKFSWSLKLHWLAAIENISLDDFISTIADIDATEQNKTFYISGFTKKAQELLDNAQSTGE